MKRRVHRADSRRDRHLRGHYGFQVVQNDSQRAVRRSFRGADEGQHDGMFPAENLRDWRGEKVIDPEGDRIGDLEAVYVDTATDEPAFVTVKVGMIGRHRLTFVPVAGATVSPSAVRVRYDKKTVSDAPGIDVDGELAAGDEAALFAHYCLPYEPGAAGQRRLGRR